MTLIPTSSTNALTLANTTPTAAGLALLDDADASAQRTTLGLGTIATLSATNPSLAGATFTGHTIYSADNTYDIGASGATRPRNAYIAGNIISGGTLVLGGVGKFQDYGSGQVGIGGSGANAYYLGAGFLNIGNNLLRWQSSADALNGTTDLILARDAAATLALRNSTTGQTFRTYNTYTDASNYERHRLSWSSNVLYSGAEALGTGTARLEVHTGAAVKALTGGTETAFVRISCADDSSLGGVIHYAIYAKDAGNDMQLRTGSLNFALVNKTGGGGLTCGLGTVINEAVTTSSGTLTVTFDSDVSGANVADIRANAVSSLTETTLDIRYRVEIFGPSTTVTPL